MTNDMPELPTPSAATTRRIPVAIGAVVIGAAIGFAGIYGIGGLKRNATGDSACRGAVELARKLAPLAHGEVAGLTMQRRPCSCRTSLSRTPMANRRGSRTG